MHNTALNSTLLQKIRRESLERFHSNSALLGCLITLSSSYQPLINSKLGVSSTQKKIISPPVHPLILSTSPNEDCSTVKSSLSIPSGPSIQSEHSEIITDQMVVKAAAFVSQLICVNLGYSTYKPVGFSSSDETTDFLHSCSLCKSSFAEQIKSLFTSLNLNHDFETLISNPSGSPISFSNAQANMTSLVIFQQQNNTHPLICALLKRLQQNIHLRACELICSLYFFNNVIKRHWECSSFFLLRNSLFIVFVVCLILSHKINNDSVMNNRWWADVAVHCVENNGTGIGLGMGGGLGMGIGQPALPAPTPSVMERYLLNNSSLTLMNGMGKGRKDTRKRKIVELGMDKEETVYEDDNENGNGNESDDEYDTSEPLRFRRNKTNNNNAAFRNTSTSSSCSSSSLAYNQTSSSTISSNKTNTSTNPAAVAVKPATSLPRQMLLKVNELERAVLVLLEHTLTLDQEMYESMRKVVQV